MASEARQNFTGGCQPLIYKHINRGLTYCYILSSQDIKLEFFTKTLHIFTLILFKRTLIRQIIFELSLV